MFNHLWLQGSVHMSHLFIMFSQVQGRKCMYFNVIPVCGKVYLGNFPINTYTSQNSGDSLANLWATIKISAPAVNQIYF